MTIQERVIEILCDGGYKSIHNFVHHIEEEVLMEIYGWKNMDFEDEGDEETDGDWLTEE